MLGPQLLQKKVLTPGWDLGLKELQVTNDGALFLVTGLYSQNARLRDSVPELECDMMSI